MAALGNLTLHLDQDCGTGIKEFQLPPASFSQHETTLGTNDSQITKPLKRKQSHINMFVSIHLYMWLPTLHQLLGGYGGDASAGGVIG